MVMRSAEPAAIPEANAEAMIHKRLRFALAMAVTHP